LDESKLPADQAAFAIRFRIQMTAEQSAETIRELDAFVALRNRLVHHFMDDFDIFSDAGCAKALQHLHDSYAEIEKQYNMLRNHLMQQEEIRQRFAAFMQTPEYLDMLTGDSTEIPKEIRF
jgi:polysaccharide pyruvyl transferase WcaK-like protein